MDIASGEVKWFKQLDLTTNRVKYRAFVYSSPTVVDLDGDGKLEIVQSTSQGFIYVFGHNGHLRRCVVVGLGCHSVLFIRRLMDPPPPPRVTHQLSRVWCW